MCDADVGRMTLVTGSFKGDTCMYCKVVTKCLKEVYAMTNPSGDGGIVGVSCFSIVTAHKLNLL